MNDNGKCLTVFGASNYLGNDSRISGIVMRVD